MPQVPGMLRDVTTHLADLPALVEHFQTDGVFTGTDVTGPDWHLAACYRCNDLAEPFVNPAARDDWAILHAAATGHSVVLSIDPNPAGNPVAILRNGIVSGWTWICGGCSTTGTEPHAHGTNYPTGAAALAGFRAHVCRDPR